MYHVFVFLRTDRSSYLYFMKKTQSKYYVHSRVCEHLPPPPQPSTVSVLCNIRHLALFPSIGQKSASAHFHFQLKPLPCNKTLYFIILSTELIRALFPQTFFVKVEG